MTGFVDSFLPEIYVDPDTTDIVWNETDFDFDPNADPSDIPGSFATLQNGVHRDVRGGHLVGSRG